MSTNTTMSVYAEALISNRGYKSTVAKVDGNAVGVENARTWNNLIRACLIPAYAVRKYQYDNMGKSEDVTACDMTELYNAIRPIINLIGEVNGDKLNAVNIANEFVAKSVRQRNIDTSVEMAHARSEYREAKKQYNEDDSAENLAKYESAKAEVKRLEGIAGNCKTINEIQTESAFIKSMEIALGDAITKQTLRPIEDILAEKAAKEAERKAKRKANKLSKKSAK